MGSARSGVIIEVVANGLIPSNPDRRPYVSFITSTVKLRWDPHGSDMQLVSNRESGNKPLVATPRRPHL